MKHSDSPNRLTPIRFIERGKRGYPYWEFQCTCGNVVVRSLYSVRYGSTKSCGCLLKDSVGASNQRRRTHGKVGSRIYKIWNGMTQRCTNPKTPKWHLYGGRGITVCERWLKFENFYADMGDCPPGKSIDRKDPDGGYCKENCRWATGYEQSANQRKALLLEYRGKKMTSAGWAREPEIQQRGLKHWVIWRRMLRGWSAYQALTVPSGKRKPEKYATYSDPVSG